MVLGVFLFGLLCMTRPAFAGGVYGNIYAYSNLQSNGEPIITSESKTVALAIIRVYNGSGTKVAETTATVCGYYTVDLPSTWGTYTVKVIDSEYDLRVVNTCATTSEDGCFYGERNVLSFGSWYQLNIGTF